MRRKSDSVGLNLDSLMDTLTNVVGILVIMLVVTQIGVKDTVQRIYANLPKVTEEDLKEAKLKAEWLRKIWKELGGEKVITRDLLAQDESSFLRLKKLIEDLKTDLAEAQKTPLDLAEYKKDVQAKQKQAKELEKKIAAASAELARLKTLLAEIPKGKTVAPVQILLPNPRPALPKTTPVYFACKGGRLRPVDLAKLRQIGETAVNLATKGKLVEGGIDCKKVKKYFADNDIGDAFFRLKFQPIRGNPYVILEQRENRGNNIEGMNEKNSFFKLLLSGQLPIGGKRLNPTRNYLRFRVWSDSFDTYLHARSIARQFGYAAGWEPYDSDYVWRIRLSGVARCTGAPPPPSPPKPNRKPNLNKKKRPPRPANLID